jgi:uncharacterized glyoxalase superfamily protein PhnB
MAGQFKLIFVTKKYEATLAFYRDGLELPLVDRWDHGLHERGAEFLAGSGSIMFSALAPQSGYTLGLSTNQQGISIGIEVADVEAWYQQVCANELPISQKLASFPWGEKGFTLTDPNGIGIYIFSANGHD